MNADEKIAQREEEGAKVDRRKKIEVDQSTAKKLMHNKLLDDEAKSRVVAITKKTSSTNFVKKSKAINSTRKSNRK